MCRDFLKSCVGFFAVLFLIAGCEGQSCIEADDFGEYDTDTISVDSIGAACQWTDDGELGTGSETVRNCIESTKKITISGTQCTVDTNENCNNIKECLNDTSAECASSFTITGSDCSTSSNEEKKVLLKSAYDTCVDECINSCTSKSGFSYETDWVQNNLKEEGGYLGIELSKSGTVNVQALGSLILQGSTSENKVFSVNTSQIQDIGFILSKGTTFTLTGKWCRNSKTLSNCDKNQQVGEFGGSKAATAVDNSDVEKRIDFLRRGVIILDSLPKDSTYTAEGKYTGPLKTPDFSAWKCEFDKSTDNVQQDTYTCYSDFSKAEAGYDEENQDLYGMEDYFKKTIGGSVVPENVKDFITTNPFVDFDCKTNLGTNRYCIPSDTEAFVIDFSGSSESNKTLRSGFILTKQGKTGLEIAYPSKLAFSIIPDSEKNGSTSGTCKVTVSVEGNGAIQKKVVNVKADGAWHFLTESENSSDRIILGGDKYNTLALLPNSNYQNLNKTYKVNIEFDDSEKWKDEDGNEISCGDGMAAFFLPQNEILVDTSGFVSFKNLLGANNKKCTTNATTDKECFNDYSLTFDIINPMYDFRNISEIDLMDKNFYEYRTLTSSIDTSSQSKTNNTKPVVQAVSVKLGSDTENDGWSEGIYVRKGQILRFDETNWFSITRKSSATEDADSYNIRNKVLQMGSYVKKPSEGLVMRIVARPAIICRGTAAEKYSNPSCNITLNENGEKVCSLSYADFCSKYNNASEGSNLTDTQKAENDRYCPFGCYDTFFLESGNEGSSCQVTSSNKDNYSNITENSCKSCQSYMSTLSVPQVEYDINVIQCYDLENYKGAVSNIGNENDPITGEAYSTLNDKTEEHGNLTKRDIDLKAVKLKSIFKDGTYGNLDGLEIDTTQKGTDGTYKDFIYNASDSLQFSSPKTFRFLLIDNPDFTFASNPTSDPSQKTSYVNNIGNYSFSFSPQEIVNNGAQMSVFVAHKDWIEKNDKFTPSASGKFKAWIVQYYMEKKENANYGKMNPNSPYEFDNNGILIDRATKSEGIDMEKLPIEGVNEDDYKNLRLFFKIIDKEEKPNDNCSTLEAQNTVEKCRCSDWNQSRGAVDCSSITCGNDATVETVNVIECKDLYSNNSGTYSVQLKTPKDVLNSTGYIVKYVMEPIMEILDGKTIGIAVDHDGKPVPCKGSDSQYTYGGILPLDQVGQICSTTHPLYGAYCFSTTEYCGANELNPVNCYLPGADRNKIGTACKVSDESNVVKNYGNYCFSTPTDRCVIYKTQDKITDYDDTFGDNCTAGSSADCVQNCSTLDSNTYKNYCKFVSDGKGFVQRFYEAVINDSAYQIILKLCFTLMISFYGLYYLLGMAELTQGELIKRIIKISFIYLMVGTDGWYYYNMFFVKFFKGGVDYLVFAVAGAFDNSSSITSAFVENNFYDKSVLFSGVDKNLSLMFSDQVTFKVWGLMFVSFFGWLYVFLIYASIIAYIMTVANALLLYLTAQFFISMLLAFGPIFFVMLVFEKTKEMFSKWINNLVSFSLEQIFLLTCLSLFNTLVYNIIKFVLSYRVCWRAVWVLNIPLLGNIELMRFWKATTASSPSAAASAVPGLFQILLIYLIADLMKEFIKFASDLGASMGGGGLSSSDLSGGIKQAAENFYNKNIKAPIQTTARKVGTAIAKKTIGYKTKDEEKKEKEANKVMRKGLRKANRDANKAVEDYKKKNGKELLALSTDERNKKLADVRRDAFKDSVESNASLTAEMNKRKMTTEDLAKSRAFDFTSSSDLVGLGTNAIFNSFLNSNKSEIKNDRIEKGKRGLHFEKDSKFGIPKLRLSTTSDFSKNEIRKITRNDEKQELKELKKQRGGFFNRQMTDKEYEDRKQEINDKKHGIRDAMNKKESSRKDDVKKQRKNAKQARKDARRDARRRKKITNDNVGFSGFLTRLGLLGNVDRQDKAVDNYELAKDLASKRQAQFKKEHENDLVKPKFGLGKRLKALNYLQKRENRIKAQAEVIAIKKARTQYKQTRAAYKQIAKDARNEVLQNALNNNIEYDIQGAHIKESNTQNENNNQSGNNPSVQNPVVQRPNPVVQPGQESQQESTKDEQGSGAADVKQSDSSANTKPYTGNSNEVDASLNKDEQVQQLGTGNQNGGSGDTGVQAAAESVQTDTHSSSLDGERQPVGQTDPTTIKPEDVATQSATEPQPSDIKGTAKNGDSFAKTMERESQPSSSAVTSASPNKTLENPENKVQVGQGQKENVAKEQGQNDNKVQNEPKPGKTERESVKSPSGEVDEKSERQTMQNREQSQQKQDSERGKDETLERPSAQEPQGQADNGQQNTQREDTQEAPQQPEQPNDPDGDVGAQKANEPAADQHGDGDSKENIPDHVDPASEDDTDAVDPVEENKE